MTPDELAKVRAKLELTQAALAAEVGVKPNTVARWERGEQPIPVAIQKLLRLMEKESGATSVVATSGAISKDPFHAQIQNGLNQKLDPDVFEACAADLLSKVWAGLVPVRGGGDSGYDGAVANLEGDAFPLIVTTGANAKANLKKNLTEAKKANPSLSRALFATSRRITPKTREELGKVAAAFGVTLHQIYDQDWFANTLYQDSAWCRKLLNISGNPPALSVIPNSSRPIIGDKLIGRDGELQRLKATEGDIALIGAPGSGKTFLLRAYAIEESAVFLNDPDRGALANDIRRLKPAAIIVDDAHLDLETLKVLRGLRTQLGQDYKIVAVSWPAEAERIRVELNIPKANVIELQPLSAETMVEVIRSFGLQGPPQLLQTIVKQAEGRPGLAATFVHLCFRGDVHDVITGDAIADHLMPQLTRILGENAVRLLAAFSLGGSVGFSQETVATFLQLPLADVSSALAKLSTAGVVVQAPDRKISVWPVILRWVLVKRVFFEMVGSLDFEPLFGEAPDRVQAILTLIGAASRGAKIRKLENLIQSQPLDEPWLRYAQLGATQCKFVLSTRPDLCVEISDAALSFAPETSIPLMLATAIGDDRPLHNSTNHPLRKIEDWLEEAAFYGGNPIERRNILVREITRWKEANKSAENLPAVMRVCCRAYCLLFDPNWRTTETVPGDGHTFSLVSGVLGLEDTEALVTIWDAVKPHIIEAANVSKNWDDVITAISHLRYGGMVSIDDALREKRLAVLRHIVEDIAKSVEAFPGVASRLVELGKACGAKVSINISSTFEALYPRERLRKDYKKEQKNWADGVDRILPAMVKLPAQRFAQELAAVEEQARLAGINYPRLTPYLCLKMAALVSAPIEWANALIQSEAISPELVEPFMKAGLERDRDKYIALARSMLGDAKHRILGVSLVLDMSDPPSDLLNEALGNAEHCLHLIEARCARGEMNQPVAEALLSSKNMVVALATAVGIWQEEKHGERSALLDSPMWREAIISTARAAEIPGNDSYWLKEIVKQDQALAYAWLSELIKSDESHRYLLPHEFRKVVTEAAAILSREQRADLLSIVKGEYVWRRVVAELVGKDVELYRLVIGRPDLKRFHLSLLEGRPDVGEWAEKAQIARAAGYSIEDIARSTMPGSRSWSGPESNYWRPWKDAFDSLAVHQSEEIREIGRQGADIIQKTIDACLEEERQESIYGRRR